MALQQKNQNEQISKKELEEIAQRLGFDINEINKAKDNYVTAGNNYLKFGNYEDALKEFSQANMLDTQNPDILFAMASCHKGIFQQKKQKKDKEQAIEHAKKVIKLEPNYQKAYALISSFEENNITVKEFNNQYKKHQSNGGVFVYGIVAGVGVLLAVMGFLTFSLTTKISSKSATPKFVEPKSISASRNVSIARITGGIHQEKSYVWAIYYTQSYENNTYIRSYKAKIIDAKTKETKEIDLKSGVNFMQSIYEQGEVKDGKIYFCVKDFYEVRDLKTGEIIETKTILANKFPQQLKDGIADIENYAGTESGWFIITTRKNDKYYYRLKDSKLFADKERNNSQLKEMSYKWYSNNNKANIETEFMLTGENTSPFYTYDYLKKSVSVMDKNSWENLKNGKNIYSRTKISVIEGSFLGGEMIYGDEKYFFGRYHKEEAQDNEVGKPTKNYVYFCADASSGKVLWQKSFVNETSVVLANLENIHTTKAQILGNKMSFVTQYLSVENAQAFGISVLNLQTGEVLVNYVEKR